MTVPTNLTMPTARVLGRLLFPIAMALLAAAAAGEGKPVGTWADVQKIQAGKAVEVEQGDWTRLRGTLVSAAEDGTILRVDGADPTLSRATLRGIAVE